MTPTDHADFGYVRVAAVSPELRVADPAFNAARIVEAIDNLAIEGVTVAAFPELCLTGYTCGDLFFQSVLRSTALEALAVVAEATRDRALIASVGLPFEVDGRLFNCAALVAGGEVRGIVPKKFLPTSAEYYEERWFSRAAVLRRKEVALFGAVVPVGADLIFELPGQPQVRIGLEICEDLWAVHPPSGALALAGATLILNLSASDELLGKATYRRDLVRQQSARCLAAYVYASAGPGESSTDVVFSGHGIVAECGQLLKETRSFSFETDVVVADVDLDRVGHERLTNTSFSAAPAGEFRRIPVKTGPPFEGDLDLRRPVAALPFVPDDSAERSRHCREIFSIQSTGLARRIRHTGSSMAVLGLSGGLDSTLAALVAVRALAKLDRGPEEVLAVVMPGPGSTGRTQTNAVALAKALRLSLREIPIGPAVELHLRDIGHPPDRHDATFENAQARERTQILMDVANQVGGFVVGTGDLSEAALGWCTFNGDQMSMYHVNIGVPKTLVRHLVQWCADEEFEGEVSDLLRDIAATPITPELLPLGADETLVQKTEEIVGPYELHDFFLFQIVRNGFCPSKVLALAEMAFAGRWKRNEILRWLTVFYDRFFAQQFKRSAMPDGPKVGTVALSPRGDWRMPSDASIAAWRASLHE